MSHDSSLPNVLMLGTGEYTTGYTAKGASDSDKSTGVVALVMLDLQRRGKVGQKIGMCGTDGRKLPAVREHMQRVLGDVYAGIDPSGILTWPANDVVDRKAYLTALKAYSPGDVAIIFTPDDTHTELALACLAAGLHVLITKPPVKTLEEHIAIARAAKAADRLCVVEVHKRYDPIYADARDRVAGLGDFSYFTAHMSQPKHQLDTFAAWAGRSSDISYYLNSHHVDFHSWSMLDLARPEIVSALGSDGVADARLGIPMEDTITLAVRWRNCVRSARGEGTEACSGGDDVTVDGARAKSSKRADATTPKEEERKGKGKGVGEGEGGGGGGGDALASSGARGTPYTSSWIAPKPECLAAATVLHGAPR